MPAAVNCLKHLTLLFFIWLIFDHPDCLAQSPPLANAFAHNDYWHKRPLYDALNNGYVHIEADVYLRGDRLVVAHMLPIFRRKRTLEKLYFEPLKACINGTNEEMACPIYPLTLMIDIKSDAERTYAALQKLFDQYRDILSGVHNGVFVQRQITVVITGHKPAELIRAQTNRYAFIDEDLTKVGQDTLTADLYRTASCRYSSLVKWDGTGKFPELQKKRLCRYIAMAHRFGKKVRLWASPEDPVVWEELLQCGVDLINTDKLSELRRFLDARGIIAANNK